MRQKTSGQNEGHYDAKLEHALDLYLDLLDSHINRGIFVLDPKNRNESERKKYECARLMLLNAGVSLQSYKKFYRPINLQTKDVVILFRVVFEGIVNALYVISSHSDIATKAFKHARQKKLRPHGRSIQIGPYETVVQMLNPPDNLDELVNEFTSTKGRELNWTSDSLMQRVEVIAAKFGKGMYLTLGGTYHGHYGISSEYIHSSLFSAIDFIGKKSNEEFYRDMIQTLWTSLTGCGMAVISLLDALEIETQIAEFRKASKTLQELTLSICENVGETQK